jgi:hypothetical protein
MIENSGKTKNTPRNAPCPCGSGRKYKYCCGRVAQTQKARSIFDAFIEMPPAITTYLFDTCVWGTIVESESTTDAFVSHFQSKNLLAGITTYTLFELSRAEKLLQRLDSLFLKARYNIWIALLYDQLLNLELNSFPTPPAMRWIPMSLISDEQQLNVMSKFANDPRFTSKRDEHLQFGNTEFMSLDLFKKNYPPDKDGRYSPAQALDFAWCNTVDFLGREYPDFLRRFRHDASALDTNKIPSIQVRSLFLFYKYYIYNQAPRESGFLDFATVSYAPYVDVYVTERNVMNALRHIKANGLMLSETQVIHITEFLDGLKATTNL